MFISVFHISTALFYQHRIPFSDQFRAAQLFIKKFGFGEFPYISASLSEIQVFAPSSYPYFSSVVERVIDNLSTVFHHFADNLFGDGAVALLHLGMGRRGRTTLFRTLHNRLYDRYLAQKRRIALRGVTLRPAVAEDIMERLGFREKLLLKSSFERPNLSYIVRHCEDKFGKLLQVCSSVPGTGIVYVRSRRKTEDIASFLRSQGIGASFYHAGLGAQTRAQRQQDWKSGKIRIMVCTNAFGMGIDKPDVRSVVHFDVPDSPEAYFQEAGRAGRDGKRSYAVLLHGSSDIRRLHQIETLSFPPLEYVEDVYHKVHDFFGIPFGAGEGRQLKFSADEFCRRYGLSRSSVFYAMKYIERTGHWTMMDDMDMSTRVEIIPARQALYDIKVSDPVMTRVMDVLLRRYTGIFSYPVLIDENHVAMMSGLTVPELRQALYRLSVEHIIRYIPASRSTVIYLRHDRLLPKDVNLMPERYMQLRRMMHDRIQTMVDYVTEDDECRSRFLLRYFGQDDAPDCGTCDVCRAKPAERKSVAR